MNPGESTTGSIKLLKVTPGRLSTGTICFVPFENF